MNREEMTTTRKSTEHTEKRRLSKDTKGLRNSKRGAGRSFKGMLKSFALQPPRTNCNTPADGEERKPFTRGTHNTNTQKLTRAHRERKHTRSTLTSDWPRACQRGLSEPIRGQCPLCPADANKVPFLSVNHLDDKANTIKA